MALRKFCWWDDNVDAVVVVDSPTHTTEIKPAVWGVERRSTGGYSSSRSSLLFNIYSAFSVAAFRSRCLQMRRTKPFFVVRQMQKLKLQYPATWPPIPLRTSPLPAVLKNFFALEHIYCGCQGKMPIGIEVWMSWMRKWVTPYLLLLSHFVNL